MSANSGRIRCLVAGNGGMGNIEGESKNTQLLFKFRDHPQGLKSPEEWESVVLQSNTFVTSDPDTLLIDYLKRNSHPQTQYSRVLQVLNSDYNDYWGPQADRAFRSPFGKGLDLDEWRALLTFQNAPGDRGSLSVWSDPGFEPYPRIEFTVASESGLTRQARAMDIPLPEDRIRKRVGRSDPSVDRGDRLPSHATLSNSSNRILPNPTP